MAIFNLFLFLFILKQPKTKSTGHQLICSVNHKQFFSNDGTEPMLSGF